jgi:hypothetical protein
LLLPHALEETWGEHLSDEACQRSPKASEDTERSGVPQRTLDASDRTQDHTAGGRTARAGLSAFRSAKLAVDLTLAMVCLDVGVGT